MQNPLLSLIASDWSAQGHRHTCFQLCRMEAGRLVAVASVVFDGETAVCLAVKSLADRSQAIIRLARIYRTRSVPQTFAAMPSRLIA